MRAYVRRRIEPPMREAGPATRFRYEIMAETPGMSLDPNPEPPVSVKRLTGSSSLDKASGGTGRGFHRNAEIPAIIGGPGHIAEVRQPDGYEVRSQLDSRGTFVRRRAERLPVKA
jgi:acetylornithine deacetylase